MRKLLFVIFIFPFFTSASFAELPLQEQLKILGEDTDVRISQLSWCESRWNERVKVWDIGSYSYGWLQFKLFTFMNEGKKYGILPKELTTKEAELLIFNKHIQIAIAKEMLKQPNGWRAWYNCSLQAGINKVSQLVWMIGN